MKTLNIDTGLIVKDSPIDQRTKTKNEKLLAYYEKAGPDYEAWSKSFNMHFGYYQKGINPFNREAMLNNMNDQVLNRLKLDKESGGTIADFGCGLGATLRHANRTYNNYDLKGVTLVPWQVQQASVLNLMTTKDHKIEIIEADYCNTPFADNSLDAVFAIESSCYATGSTKKDLLGEIHRVLKPGGRFVIADGFRKNSQPLGTFIKPVYDKLCTSWSLTELGDINKIADTLKALGFKEVSTEDISMKVAPSVAHVPFTVINFLIRQLLFDQQKMNKERWDNLKSPLLTMIIGSCQRHFGYYLVSGEK